MLQNSAVIKNIVSNPPRLSGIPAIKSTRPKVKSENARHLNKFLYISITNH